MIEIARIGPEGWERVRALRLRALTDSPDAFARTHAEEVERPQVEWQARLRGAATFLSSRDGRDTAMVTCAPYHGRPHAAGLFGMWVAPAARGTGTGSRLVDAVIAYARAQGFERVVLDVGDINHAAIALYARKGFVPSGVRDTLPAPREHIHEHERVLVL